MMKKFILAAFCACVALPTFAQNTTDEWEETVEYSTSKHKVITNTFWNNWFVSVGAGGNLYTGDHDKQQSFGKRIAPALDLAVGKWFSPEIGARLVYSGLKVSGATKHPNDPMYTSAHGNGKPVDGGGSPHYLEEQRFSFYNLHADVLFNLSNLIVGYNPQRFYNLTMAAGIGWAAATSHPVNQRLSGNLSFINSFRLSDALDLNIELRAMLTDDSFDGEGGGRYDEGMYTANIGFTYKFKQRGWDRSKTVYRTNYGEINALRKLLDDMTAENDRLKKALDDCNNKEVQTIVKRIGTAANLVTFKINKTDLSKEARVNLGLLAQVIKSGDSDEVYVITGYADEGTGTAEINERLSQERARVVYDCLVNEFGVNPKQLEMEHKGGVPNMYYDDPCLSRAVITRSK